MALAIAASACGRIHFDDETGVLGRCDWSRPPRLRDERLRAELSTARADSDPFFVRGDPLTITITWTSDTTGLDILTAHRPSLASDFDPPTLVSDLATAGDELALQLDTTGSGYFVRRMPSDGDLYEVERVDGTLQVVRALTELNDAQQQLDPHVTADGLALWFATSTPTASQEIMIAHRADTSSMWSNVEPFVFNTPGADGGATLTDDQLVVVWTSPSQSGPIGAIWYATRPTPTAPWSARRELLQASDRAYLEPSIRGDGCELLFARSAPTDLNWDIYSVDIE